MRRLLAALLCALSMLMAAASSPAELCGDCIDDGQVDVLDALQASRHEVGLIVLDSTAIRLGDVRGDGRIDLLDALRIAQHSAGLSVTFTCLLAPLPAPIATFEGHFVTSQVCAECHANAPGATAMRDELGQPVGAYDLWQSSMMANSARDPFWRAQVSAEIAAAPSRASEIQSECLKCHAPMASTEAALSGEPRPGLEILSMDTPRGQLARDGVSCTLCHQIQPDDLGSMTTYLGEFNIDASRQIFGPHSDPLSPSMAATSTYTPVYGDHIIDSGLCGNCHTTIIETLDSSGVPTGGKMLEQSPYQEWLNSDYSTERASPTPDAATCQDCHTPLDSAQGVPIRTRIARAASGIDDEIAERSPYGRHVFVGGNTLIPQIIRDNADELGALATPAAFDSTIALAREQLRNRTATLTIGAPSWDRDMLLIPVNIQNRCGHKFPSGYPSRRAWIRLEVKDATGATVFLSGDFDAGGRLLDGNGKPHPIDKAGGPIEPHHLVIDDPERVQVYEAIMADTVGVPTFLLMRAAGFHKDNRILPLGWDPLFSDIAGIAPTVAGADDDYAATATAGADNLVYQVIATQAAGPFTIRATLLYETISVRTAEELFQSTSSEVAAFKNYYLAADRAPEIVAEHSVVTP